MAIDFTVSSDLVTPALLLKIRAGLAKHLGLAAAALTLFVKHESSSDADAAKADKPSSASVHLAATTATAAAAAPLGTSGKSMTIHFTTAAAAAAAATTAAAAAHDATASASGSGATTAAVASLSTAKVAGASRLEALMAGSKKFKEEAGHTEVVVVGPADKLSELAQDIDKGKLKSIAGTKIDQARVCAKDCDSGWPTTVSMKSRMGSYITISLSVVGVMLAAVVIVGAIAYNAMPE